MKILHLNKLNAILFLCVFSLILFLKPSTLSAQTNKIQTIVLDAGHGGKDIGFPHLYWTKSEKEINLDIVLALEKILKDSLPHLKVVLTRNNDKKVSLSNRIKTAHKVNADLFLSIHVNESYGSDKKVVSGYKYNLKTNNMFKVVTPTYQSHRDRDDGIMGAECHIFGLEEQAAETVKKSSKEKTIEEKDWLLSPADVKKSVEAHPPILLAESARFANLVHKSFEEHGRVSRGVFKEPIRILANNKMPSVVIKVGYINNLLDSIILNAEEEQQSLAMAIYQAIKSYSQSIE